MDTPSPQPAVFLVFGDLHGRILPAFRFGSYWAGEPARRSTASCKSATWATSRTSRMDKASIRHAERRPAGTRRRSTSRTEPTSPTKSSTRPALPAGIVVHRREPRRLRRTGTIRTSRRPASRLRGGRLLSRSRHQGRAGPPSPAGCASAAVWGVDGGGAERRDEPPAARLHLPSGRSPHSRRVFDVLLTHDAAGATQSGSGTAASCSRDADRTGATAVRVLRPLPRRRQPRSSTHTAARKSTTWPGFELRTARRHRRSRQRRRAGVGDGEGTFAFVPGRVAEDLHPRTTGSGGEVARGEQPGGCPRAAQPPPRCGQNVQSPGRVVYSARSASGLPRRRAERAESALPRPLKAGLPHYRCSDSLQDL